jgi:hypothetical protein
MSLILEEVEKLLIVYEQEYAVQPGQPSSFWDRNKGKIMLGGGLIGLGLVGAKGGLGMPIKNMIQNTKGSIKAGYNTFTNAFNPPVEPSNLSKIGSGAKGLFSDLRSGYSHIRDGFNRMTGP